LTDNSGKIRAQYDYAPYGLSSKLAGDLDTNISYTGHYRHGRSGLLLAPFRAYEPTLGRWLNRDPIEEDGGFNLYGYVGNNPVNFVDPLGYCPWCLFARPPVIPEPLLETERIVGHHSDPKFTGGDPKQELTRIPESQHKDLHRDMNDFLREQTNEDGYHMRPQRDNSGSDIQKTFERNELLDALKRFYEKFRDKYPEPAKDFFKQHPELCDS
jgi:RHS repeat-associated protein